MPSEKPCEVLTGIPATSEYVNTIWAIALKVQMIELTLAILMVRVYAGCCSASSGTCLPRLGILVQRGKIIAANISAPKVSAQATLWMALVAGRAQRVSAPGSDSSWTPVTPDWIPMTMRNATPVITETGQSQFGAGVVCVVVFVNGAPRCR